MDYFWFSAYFSLISSSQRYHSQFVLTDAAFIPVVFAVRDLIVFMVFVNQMVVMLVLVSSVALVKVLVVMTIAFVVAGIVVFSSFDVLLLDIVVVAVVVVVVVVAFDPELLNAIVVIFASAAETFAGAFRIVVIKLAFSSLS